MNGYFTDRQVPGRREMEDALARRTGLGSPKGFCRSHGSVPGPRRSRFKHCRNAGESRRRPPHSGDFDRVDVTNLNRQQYKACQTGMLKTEALRENLLEIAPYADLITVTEKITEASFDRSPESDCRAGMSSVFARLAKPA